MPSTTSSFGFEAFVFLNGDDAFVADFLHRVGDLVADFGFAVCGDGADLRDFVGVFDLARQLLPIASTTSRPPLSMPRFRSIGFMPAATDFRPSLHDGLCQNRGSGGAVTGFVIGARGHFLHHLRAHVFELVLQVRLPWQPSHRPW